MKTTFKHLFLSLLIICLLVANCNVYALETVTKDTSIDLTISTPAYVSDGSGQVRYSNRNNYIAYSNGSFVLYLSHSNAIAYKNRLSDSYAQGLATGSWNWIGYILGVIAGTVITLASAGIAVTVTSSAALNMLSCGISTLGTNLLNKAASVRISWMNNLSNRIDEVLNICDSNVGIYVSFNAYTTTYSVGIQTY